MTRIDRLGFYNAYAVYRANMVAGVSKNWRTKEVDRKRSVVTIKPSDNTSDTPLEKIRRSKGYYLEEIQKQVF